MLNLNSLMLGSTQVEKMAKFYQEVFQKKADMEEGGWYGWQVGSCFLTLGEHSDAKGQSKEPFRIMFNLETTDVQKEFDRIKDIENVTVVKEPYDPGMGALIATFADPDGNYFQLMTPWEENSGK